jgi:dihydroxyacid dehydratase/phosphogluconate dehydratase
MAALFHSDRDPDERCRAQPDFGAVEPSARAWTLALVETGDRITLDVPNRKLELRVPIEELEKRTQPLVLTPTDQTEERPQAAFFAGAHPPRAWRQ